MKPIIYNERFEVSPVWGKFPSLSLSKSSVSVTLSDSLEPSSKSSSPFEVWSSFESSGLLVYPGLFVSSDPYESSGLSLSLATKITVPPFVFSGKFTVNVWSSVTV